jgi:fimbrial chaperone protein
MKLRFLILFISVFFSFNVFAFKFSPMSTSIELKDKKNSTLFFMENDSDRPIAVQLSLLKREMNIDGIEANSKIDNELTLYPSQLIIPANEKRSVKVAWVGKVIPTKELSYRLVAEQLPIELEKDKKKKASIKVLLRYVAALYIIPEDFSSEVVLEKLDTEEKNVILKLSNKGKKHQVLTNLSLTFSSDKKKEIVIKAEELTGMSGENILAESMRVFRFAKQGKFQGLQSTDKVKISFEKE